MTPTVNEIPEGMTTMLPLDFEKFKEQWEVYVDLLFNGKNIREFLRIALLKTAQFANDLALWVIPVLCLFLILYVTYTTPNDKPNEDTRALRIYKKLEKVLWYPPKRFVLGYIRFVKERFYGKLLCGIWAWNFSVITIAIEVIAWIFYFSVSFDLVNLYIQFLKLLLDLSIPAEFLPLWCWVLIGAFVFDKIRRAMGIKILRKHEEASEKFLETHPGALFIVGKQRSKKTSLMTSLALTQSVVFRKKAFEKLSERDKQFPQFPWLRLEMFCKKALKNHSIYTLAGCRHFSRLLRDCFYGKYNKGTLRGIRRHVLQKMYGYEYGDFIFGYDYKTNGLKFRDNLRVIDIFEAIENYMQEYFIYTAPTSLLFSNYGIREEIRWEDYGHFPKMYGDFFDIDPDDALSDSIYSHIMDMDAARMLKKMDEKNPKKDGFEVGGVIETEYAKERGNQHTNAGQKASDEKVNSSNDGHENDLKMRGHAATIDNYTFFRLMLDDQRADSLKAENRDLCDIVHIKKTSDAKIVMPFFAFEEALELILTGIYDKVYYTLRNLRGDNTLLVYLMQKLYIPLHNHYLRIANKYSEHTVTAKVWDAMDDELKEEQGKLYISWKKAYSGRFATDSLKGYYHEKALGSPVGLNDYEPFKGLEMSTEEMKTMHSLFYDKIIKILEQERNTRNRWKRSG